MLSPVGTLSMAMELASSIVPNLPLLPVFTSLFLSIYLLAYHVLFHNWSPKHRPEASSCFTSLAHGTPATVLALCSILFHAPPTLYSSPNTRLHNLAIDFSTAYFTVDVLHYLVFFPHDCLFVAHHLATLFVLLTCRHVAVHGATSVSVLLFLAEITSACQNAWTLAGIRKADDPLAARAHRSLAPPFFAFYTLTRGVAAPAFLWKMGAFYVSGKASGAIPWWLTFSWVVVVGGGVAASILWVLNNWVVLYNERCAAREMKRN